MCHVDLHLVHGGALHDGTWNNFFFFCPTVFCGDWWYSSRAYSSNMQKLMVHQGDAGNTSFLAIFCTFLCSCRLVPWYLVGPLGKWGCGIRLFAKVNHPYLYGVEAGQRHMYIWYRTVAPSVYFLSPTALLLVCNCYAYKSIRRYLPAIIHLPMLCIPVWIHKMA